MTKFYSVLVWYDAGGPEDGIIPCTARHIIQANNEWEALLDVSDSGAIVCFYAEDNVREATPDEVSEYLAYDAYWEECDRKIAREQAEEERLQRAERLHREYDICSEEVDEWA